jgi:hypothetical protein
LFIVFYTLEKIAMPQNIRDRAIFGTSNKEKVSIYVDKITPLKTTTLYIYFPPYLFSPKKFPAATRITERIEAGEGFVSKKNVITS